MGHNICVWINAKSSKISRSGCYSDPNMTILATSERDSFPWNQNWVLLNPRWLALPAARFLGLIKYTNCLWLHFLLGYCRYCCRFFPAIDHDISYHLILDIFSSWSPHAVCFTFFWPNIIFPQTSVYQSCELFSHVTSFFLNIYIPNN